jgi:hypothetical protein
MPNYTLKEIQSRNPNWSSYTCFAEWVRGRHLENGKLRRAFLRDVEREDYLPSERDSITNFLYELSNGSPYSI